MLTKDIIVVAKSQNVVNWGKASYHCRHLPFLGSAGAIVANRRELHGVIRLKLEEPCRSSRLQREMLAMFNRERRIRSAASATRRAAR